MYFISAPAVQFMFGLCKVEDKTRVAIFAILGIYVALAGGVKEGQNMAQNGPRFYIFLVSEPSRGP